MQNAAPQIVQYQGSKRLLAHQILKYMPAKFDRLIEPFSGLAAISIATAISNRAMEYVINDLNKPIIDMLTVAINNPETLIAAYRILWLAQFDFEEGHIQHFYHVRERFNNGEQTPETMLYLLARCVKGAVRYGRSGNFNQSPDKRRHGTNPDNIARNVFQVSGLLKGKSSFMAMDFREILELAKPGDLIYMDPPYQGVSNVRDNRYFAGVSFGEFVESIEQLNRRKVDYIISYDGLCGDKAYGEELPECLKCTRILLKAGPSSQATLLGRKEQTLEALYISENLSLDLPIEPEQLSIWDVTV